jgi:hypothetical protein
MQMRIDGDDAVDASREQRTYDLLADRFALVKGGILPHVTQVRRDEHEALGASAPQCFGRKQQRDQFVVWPVQRSVMIVVADAGPTVTRISPSGKAWMAIS